jgi:hypothetical protein
LHVLPVLDAFSQCGRSVFSVLWISCGKGSECPTEKQTCLSSRFFYDQAK